MVQTLAYLQSGGRHHCVAQPQTSRKIMAWEQRGGQRYYYKKIRKGDKVVSQYWGNGPEARGVAAMQEVNERRVWRKENAMRKMKEEVEAIDPLLDALERTLQTLTRSTLLLAGFHEHKGQWRRRRMQANQGVQGTSPDDIHQNKSETES